VAENNPAPNQTSAATAAMIIVKKTAPAKRTKKISSADEIRKTGVTVCLLPLCIPARLREGSGPVSGELLIYSQVTPYFSKTAA
jgi:hypothetical protein